MPIDYRHPGRTKAAASAPADPTPVDPAVSQAGAAPITAPVPASAAPTGPGAAGPKINYAHPRRGARAVEVAEPTAAVAALATVGPTARVAPRHRAVERTPYQAPPARLPGVSAVVR